MDKILDWTGKRYEKYTHLNREIRKIEEKMELYSQAYNSLKKCLDKRLMPAHETGYLKEITKILSSFMFESDRRKLELKAKRKKLEDNLKNNVNGYITEVK